ncbi:hypothetical protein BSKO_12042 [Bryopsis sp. KO-2023]|nr:hypothetical protein BSKO_12042 [Bryopsis sp. KO-2023]
MDEKKRRLPPTIPHENLPPSPEKFRAAAVSWTGGKDSALAMHLAQSQNFDVRALVTFVPAPENGIRKEFKAHPVPMMKLQSQALGIQHLEVTILPQNGDYKAAYVEGLNQVRGGSLGCGTVVSGDIDFVGTMRDNWLRMCALGCENELRILTPIWHWERIKVLNKLIEDGFLVIFSCVKEPWFGKEWLGRVLDDKAVVDLMEIEGRCMGFDLAGENGEYHTMTLDGPGFSQRVIIESSSKEIVPRSERGVAVDDKDVYDWWFLKIEKCRLEAKA